MTNNAAEQEHRLSPRQREVLRLLVQEYVASANPVGSGTVLKLGALGVSSATIRNELALLEELGYLTHPHTSAGRVPTVKGYRYFIEELMGQVELPAHSRRMIRHQFHQIRLDMDQWMQLTAAVLAQLTRSASLVTAPHARLARFKHLELISTHDTLILMILVLQDGSIHQEMMVTEEPVEQAELSRLSNQLNDQIQNHTLDEITGSQSYELERLTGWEEGVLAWVVRRMDQVDEHAVNEIHQAGLANVLEQPEFEDAGRFRQLLEVMERRQQLETILSKALNASGVQIIIGGEGPFEDIYDVSLVLSPYGIRDKASGVLGVMGPTRMPYAKAISAVRYVAELMDGLITQVYGE